MAKQKVGFESLGFDFFGSDEARKKFGVADFINTGSYNLNRIISGSLFKGIPEKRITALIGEEAVGKTLFVLAAAREAIKKGYLVAYFDSENALTQEFAENVGVEIDNLIYTQVATIEDFRRRALKLIEWKTENYGRDKKLLIILDSFGGLTAKKFVDDVDAGKDTMDMGVFAKIAKATFKMIGVLMAPNNVTMIYTNHITTDTSGYMPVKVQTGGMVARYYPSVVLFLKKKLEKASKDEVTGINIIAHCTKGRFAPPYQTAEIYLDWREGLDPYSGLFDIALQVNLIEPAGQGWYKFVGTDTKGRASELEEALRKDERFIKRLNQLIIQSGYKTVEPIAGEEAELSGADKDFAYELEEEPAKEDKPRKRRKKEE